MIRPSSPSNEKTPGLRTGLRDAWPIYLAALTFLILRRPFYTLHGMTGAEETSVYLRYAWDASVLRALVAPHQFYYSLYANLCGLLAARVLPLEAAAHFMLWCEFAVEMLLVFTLVQCERFTSLTSKSLAVAVGLLAVPNMSIAYSTVNAQFYVAILSGVILISDSERLRTLRVMCLVFAALNGVLSCVLLPFFIFEAWRERSTGRVAQAAAMSMATVLQACAVLYATHAQVGRSVGTPSTLGFLAAALLANGPLNQFFTYHAGVEACRAVGSPKLARWGDAVWLVCEVAASAYLVGVTVATWFGGRETRFLGLAALLCLVVGLSRGGANNYSLMCDLGAHYFVMFNIFLGLALVLLQQRGTGGLAVTARVAVACLLVSGLVDVTVANKFTRAPIWAREVALWRADPNYRLLIPPAFWPPLTLTREHGNRDLPMDIYDSTSPGWRDR